MKFTVTLGKLCPTLLSPATYSVARKLLKLSGLALSLWLLQACGASSPEQNSNRTVLIPPGPESIPKECANDRLSEADILAVTRNPADAPLADLSHYEARNAVRAPDAVLNSGACANNRSFRYAAGVGDITGPLEGSMSGYVDGNQISNGLIDRQHARAYIFESNCTGRNGRALLVQLDIGLSFGSIRQTVLERLAADAELGPRYGQNELLLNASHSHATAAGQSHYDAYHVLTGGHDAQALDAAVQGIMNAIRHAHANLQNAGTGPILFTQGELLNGTTNRSLPAFLNNPEAERRQFLDTNGNEVRTNRMMTLLKLQRDDGTEVGMLNWYPIHGTSLWQRNFLLSGDNKGYAAYRFEQDFATDYFAADGSETFLAGFMQADEGDASPNLFIPELTEAELRDLESAGFRNRAGGRTEAENALISGYKQYRNARELYASASESLVGEIVAKQLFIDFTRVQISNPATYPAALQPAANSGFETCSHALGVSFAGGAEDGRGPTAEGQTCTNVGNPAAIVTLLENNFAAGMNGALPPGLLVPVGCDNLVYDALGYQCHAEKPIIFPLNLPSPFATNLQTLEPGILPVQIVVLGNLAIIALPWEITTIAGRRLRNAVLDTLEDAGVDYAVISGLSNGFVHYMTTREEYATQQYEGASTIFGPWTHEAVQQEVVRLAQHIRDGSAPTSPFQSPAFRSSVTSLTNNTDANDGTPNGNFGDVVLQPEASYTLGADAIEVVVRFVAGHPRNDLKLESSYFFIEQLAADGNWVAVQTDHDFFTRFEYQQGANGDENQALVRWLVPPETEPGVYRVRHTGASNSGSYEGISDSFMINPCGLNL